jgi:hypothetical protein
MPFLDLSDVLDDPDFTDTLLLTQETVTLDSHGRTVSTPVRRNISGVVTSDRGRNRDLLAEGQRISGSILVHTRTPLTSGGEGRMADLLTWNGRDYIVATVDDYTRYGAGFICAHCDLKPLNGGGDGI